MIESITPEAFDLKNLSDLAKEVFEKAPEVSSTTKQLITDILIDSTDKKKTADQERAETAFTECFIDNYGLNSNRIVENLAGTSAETHFRHILKTYAEILEGSPGMKKALIEDHYADLLKKASKINQALAELSQ